MWDFIARIFKRKKPVDQRIAIENVQTAPLTQEQLESVTVETVSFEPPQLLVATGQSVGKQREHNEDSIFALNSMLVGDVPGLPFGIFVVGDGMGGHQHGEVASGMAVRAVAGYLIRRLYLPFISLKPENSSEPVQEVLQAAVKEAQQAVLKYAPGGGTTLTCALVIGEQVTLAHVGDSRAYFIHPDGRIQTITRDHSLVRRLQELGQITEKEAAVHPQRNVLYRAVGQAEPFDPDINTHPMPQPGYLMLCSDGLWGVISEEDIFRIVTSAANPAAACHELVAAANGAGGPDNISVILVQYPNP